MSARSRCSFTSDEKEYVKQKILAGEENNTIVDQGMRTGALRSNDPYVRSKWVELCNRTRVQLKREGKLPKVVKEARQRGRKRPRPRPRTASSTFSDALKAIAPKKNRNSLADESDDDDNSIPLCVFADYFVGGSSVYLVLVDRIPSINTTFTLKDSKEIVLSVELPWPSVEAICEGFCSGNIPEAITLASSNPSITASSSNINGINYDYDSTKRNSYNPTICRKRKVRPPTDYVFDISEEKISGLERLPPDNAILEKFPSYSQWHSVYEIPIAVYSGHQHTAEKLSDNDSTPPCSPPNSSQTTTTNTGHAK